MRNTGNFAKPKGWHFLVLGLLLIIGMAGWVVGRVVRQEQRNQQLIAAIKSDNANDALVLLADGANANSREAGNERKSWWRWFHDTFWRRPTAQGQAALLLALERRRPNLQVVEQLLSHGADPNVANEEATALSLAVDSRQVLLVRLLLEHKANPNTGEQVLYGEQPLVLAAENGDEDTVRLLINYGADANYKDAEMERESADGNDGSALYAVSKELMFEPHNQHLRNILTLLNQFRREHKRPKH